MSVAHEEDAVTLQTGGYYNIKHTDTLQITTDAVTLQTGGYYNTEDTSMVEAADAVTLQTGGYYNSGDHVEVLARCGRPVKGRLLQLEVSQYASIQ